MTINGVRHEYEQAAKMVRRQLRRDGNVHPDTEAWFARALRAYVEACAELQGHSRDMDPQDAAMRRLARIVLRGEREHAARAFAQTRMTGATSRALVGRAQERRERFERGVDTSVDSAAAHP